MKKLLNTFYFAAMLIGIISNWAFAQLPFEPFVAYPGNPVIPRTASSWDAGTVIGASMVFVNDTFYVCYEGVYRDLFYYPNDPMSLGLATSIDGFTFEKSSANPILSGDGSGFDSFSAQAGALYYDNVHWYLYYGGLAAPPTIPTRIVSRAIATSPHGPWVRTNDTLLIGGSEGEWDDKCCAALQILPTDSGLVMYYFGSDGWFPNAFTCQIGMATSTDGGATWQKYNDPTTTTPPYAESDPVLKAGPELDIWGAGVIRHNNLWEMFYSGQTNPDTLSIYYATSPDGIHWTKYSEDPIFSADPVSVGMLEIPTVVFDGSKYFLIYDYGIGPYCVGIGLATANIVPISIISINPTELDFGEVAIDSSATMTFTIINTGNADLEVTNISSNEPAFTVITSAIVPPYSSQEVEVTFTPTEEIQYNGIIEISHNALGSPDTVIVTGEGVIVPGVEDELKPLTFSLAQNYPNPFNPVTMIKYQIPELSFVTIKVYDVLGNEITTLVNEEKQIGSYEVEFRPESSIKNPASGIYFYQLKAGGPEINSGQAFIETKKMLLLK